MRDTLAAAALLLACADAASPRHNPWWLKTPKNDEPEHVLQPLVAANTSSLEIINGSFDPVLKAASNPLPIRAS